MMGGIVSEKKRRIGRERPASITIGGQTLVDLGGFLGYPFRKAAGDTFGVVLQSL